MAKAAYKLLPTDAFLSRNMQEMHLRPGIALPQRIEVREWQPTSKGMRRGDGETP